MQIKNILCSLFVTTKTFQSASRFSSHLLLQYNHLQQSTDTFCFFSIASFFKRKQLSASIKMKCNRARWLRGNARDSHSGGPGFKSRGRPTYLRFLVVSSILKQLRNQLFFKGKRPVDPHIPLLLIQYLIFTVSRDLKPLLSKW